MHPILRDKLRETAYYAAPTGKSNAGDYTFGAPTSFLCRTEPDSVYHGPQFIPRAGEDRETNIIIFTEVDFPETARIWLPGSDTSTALASRRIKRRETVRDLLGVISHYEIYV